MSRRALRWALEGLAVQHLTVARIAQGLAVSWNTANDAVLAEGRRVLIEDVQRFDGVKVIGVDEHVWRHTRRGDKDVTVIIDLTPIRDRTGPSRLLDMVEGRSKAAFKAWLAGRPQAWRDGLRHAHRVRGLTRQLPRGDLVPELTLLRTVVARMARRPHRPPLGHPRLAPRWSSHSALLTSGGATTG